jgi:AcrR family transcriptional regulator
MRKLSHAERTEQSDQRMVESAITIIQERGISGLRLTEVGILAGYSRGLASMRFGTLEVLLRRVARHLSVQWLDELTKSVAHEKGLAAVYSALDANARYLAPPSTARVQFLILFHSLDPSAKEHLNVARVLAAQRRDIARWISEAIESGEVKRGIDPEAEATSIVGSLNGIIFQSLIDGTLPWTNMWEKLKAEITERLSLPE